VVIVVQRDLPEKFRPRHWDRRCLRTSTCPSIA
jgi:hypothetical protein